MELPARIISILEDRESGSIALLNRLIPVLEQELGVDGFSPEAFLDRVAVIRTKLSHFAAIENFLAALCDALEGQDREALKAQEEHAGRGLAFLANYREYWQESAEKVADNFLRIFSPEGKTLLTHSHSQTILSLMEKLQERKIGFQIIQTLSVPGEEGRIACEKFRQTGVKATLIPDEQVEEVLSRVDQVLMGCDALLPGEFMNKKGTRAILEKAQKIGIPRYVVAESRKRIGRPGWKAALPPHPLFEWVPLDLLDAVVTEEA
jgi:translation initiation factor eIF-2B subunit alpha